MTGLVSRMGIGEEFCSPENNFRSAMFIDLDRFKQVNDQAGHQVGDQILREVACRLTNALPAQAIAGRLGGDEFLILQENCDEDYLQEFATNIIDQIESPIDLEDGSFCISASIGISIIDQKATLEDVFHESDNAMYQAKRDGRGNAAFFTDELEQQIRLRTKLESELRSIIDQDRFPVVGQPVYDLRTGKIRAVGTAGPTIPARRHPTQPGNLHPDHGRSGPDSRGHPNHFATGRRNQSLLAIHTWFAGRSPGRQYLCSQSGLRLADYRGL